jgi:hypothetical protein
MINLMVYTLNLFDVLIQKPIPLKCYIRFHRFVFYKIPKTGESDQSQPKERSATYKKQ